MSTTAGGWPTATTPGTTSWTDYSGFVLAFVVAGADLPAAPAATMAPLMGVCYSGKYKGKLMWVHHTHDASLWPPCGRFTRRSRPAQGGGGARKFRLRWTESAEHGPPDMLPTVLAGGPNTWLIDYPGIKEQSLKDLVDWVEGGVEPSGTNYTYEDGRVSLPATAAERGGIQPFGQSPRSGGPRAEVRSGSR